MAKTARAKGLAYTSVKTGKPMPAAKIGPPCRCPKQCFDVLGKDNIATVFKAYYDIGDNYTAKSAYLNGQIRPRTTERRRPKNRDIPTKTQYDYIISVHPHEFQVYREAFAAKIIKYSETHPAGTPVVDKRGSGPSANKITGPKLQHVHDHIESLAVTTSHYFRAHSPHHHYMSAEFTVKNLWDRYVE